MSKKNRKHTILVVEDEPAVLLTYRMLLEEQGYYVRAAGSCEDANAAISKRRFDLLLCDLSLEHNRTGFEVFACARQRDPGTPCVLLTGYADREATEKARASGIAVLFKPIEVEEFLKTIKDVLSDAQRQEAAAGDR